MSSLQDPYDLAERGTERAEQWKPSEQDPLRVGRVEQWKLITPRDRPEEPVWLCEGRDRDGKLWSKFISEAALQVKLIGEKLTSREAIEAARPDQFRVKVGDIVAIRWLGKFPHSEKPGQSVTRWAVNVVTPDDEPVADDAGEASGQDGIPF